MSPVNLNTKVCDTAMLVGMVGMAEPCKVGKLKGRPCAS